MAVEMKLGDLILKALKEDIANPMTDSLSLMAVDTYLYVNQLIKYDCYHRIYTFGVMSKLFDVELPGDSDELKVGLKDFLSCITQALLKENKVIGLDELVGIANKHNVPDWVFHVSCHLNNGPMEMTVVDNRLYFFEKVRGRTLDKLLSIAINDISETTCFTEDDVGVRIEALHCSFQGCNEKRIYLDLQTAPGILQFDTVTRTVKYIPINRYVGMIENAFPVGKTRDKELVYYDGNNCVKIASLSGREDFSLTEDNMQILITPLKYKSIFKPYLLNKDGERSELDIENENRYLMQFLVKVFIGFDVEVERNINHEIMPSERLSVPVIKRIVDRVTSSKQRRIQEKLLHLIEFLTVIEQNTQYTQVNTLMWTLLEAASVLQNGSAIGSSNSEFCSKIQELFLNGEMDRYFDQSEESMSNLKKLLCDDIDVIESVQDEPHVGYFELEDKGDIEVIYVDDIGLSRAEMVGYQLTKHKKPEHYDGVVLFVPGDDVFIIQYPRPIIEMVKRKLIVAFHLECENVIFQV